MLIANLGNPRLFRNLTSLSRGTLLVVSFDEVRP
jgi:hypothetical protein